MPDLTYSRKELERIVRLAYVTGWRDAIVAAHLAQLVARPHALERMVVDVLGVAQ